VAELIGSRDSENNVKVSNFSVFIFRPLNLLSASTYLLGKLYLLLVRH
jgi:hypothetical protein